MKKFTQLCIWPGTVVGKDNIKDFENFMKQNFNGTRVKYLEEVRTLPTPGGDRNDLFFYVHSDDIMKFSIPRLQYGIRWWEDVLSNGDGDIYPSSILEKYPKTW